MRPVTQGNAKSLDKLLPDLKKLIASDAAKHRASAPASETQPGAPTTKRALLAAAEANKQQRRAAIPVRAPVGKKPSIAVGDSAPGSIGKTASASPSTPSATPSKQSSRIAALAASKHTPSPSSPLKPIVASASKPAASATKRRVERAASDDSDIQIIEPLTPKALVSTATIVLDDADDHADFKTDAVVDGDFGLVAPPRKKQRRAFIDDADDGGMVEERFVKYIKVRTLELRSLSRARH